MFTRMEIAFAYARLFTVCRAKCDLLLATLVLSELAVKKTETLGEAEYAQWLRDDYLTDPWDLWFYTASDTAGVLPNQNPIESHNRTIKATAVIHLRAATGHVLAGTLPKILVECAMDIGSEPIRPYASEYFFSAEHYIETDDNLHGLKLNGNRTKTYKASLRGKLKQNEKVENTQQRFLSFHVVEILERIPLEHDWDNPSWSTNEIKMIRPKFKCDCKQFYQIGWLCTRGLACLHLVDALDLQVMLRNLPARKPPGRPRKKDKMPRSGW
ncbi:uncharacterized protein PITG_06974 [Phytophthora infestans T30-4]|uniref:SWIM-type domain-containing protein n=1 Tax=Phytophthora infestans (strain T30-4) TaxID=403677 RepID=D0N6Y1_PHYIT|nr:uncharacterized protein PITG_06974 [Phytophthora infestans T30-4]EEY53330.1 conserved hypothetical protein [Phytophthora infestans T30-4]|eukprot:XP_002904948.1 conserved hypothetical protein [Phytophthora infestans T30-4]